jgi:LPS-assembly lipoprotein
MWCSERRGLVAGLAALIGLAACGFEPLYAPGGDAAAARGTILVDTIDGAAGFTLRERLVTRLGPAEAPTHRLDVDLSIESAGVAITEQDVTTRFSVTGRADWRLVPLGAAEPVLSGEARAITGFSAPASETASAFASLSAERDAERRVAVVLAEDIARDLALRAGELGP